MSPRYCTNSHSHWLHDRRTPFPKTIGRVYRSSLYLIVSLMVSTCAFSFEKSYKSEDFIFLLDNYYCLVQRPVAPICFALPLQGTFKFLIANLPYFLYDKNQALQTKHATLLTSAGWFPNRSLLVAFKPAFSRITHQPFCSSTSSTSNMKNDSWLRKVFQKNRHGFPKDNCFGMTLLQSLNWAKFLVNIVHPFCLRYVSNCLGCRRHLKQWVSN